MRALLALVVGVRLFGQSTSAELAGVAKSQDQRSLPNVAITLTQRATGFERTVTTSADGSFVIPSLAAGEYVLRAELANFKTATRPGIVLRVSERARVDVILEVGDLQQEVTITDSAALLRTDNAEFSEHIANQRVVNLPLNGRRFTDLTLLSDNVVAEPRGTRGAALGQTGATIAVAGQRGGHNMYFLDGASVTDQYFNNLTLSPPIDSIQEFTVQKSIYAAEYGGKASATISAATKSGSNDLHGSLYEFFRNSALDARNFFNVAKPPLRQNQFGGTLGGALRRDRTFFFVAGEALRERRALTRTFSLPTDSVRGGDFTGLSTIYDPLSGNVQTLVRAPFPANKIPVERLDPIAKTFLAKVPKPNLAGNVQNFLSTPRLTNDSTQGAVRIDHRIGEKDTLYARYSTADFSTFRPFGSSDLNETLVPGFGTGISTYTRNFVINHTHVFRPNLVHDLRFAVLRVTGGQSLENQSVDFAALSGLRGVTSDPRKLGYPAMNFGETYSSMGDPASVVSRRNTSFDLFSNTTWVRGSHTLKVGAYLYRLRFNPFDSPNARGSFSFTPRFTSSAAGLANGNSFADFLLGYPSTALAGIGRGEESGRSTWIHFYGQDDWRVSRNLVMNLGLRYEINGHISDTENRLSNVQLNRFVIASDDQGRTNPDAHELLPLIPLPVVTSQAAGYPNSLLRPSYRRFAPRFGVAWNPGGSDRTVIRAGFGLFFNQWAYSVQTALMQNLPFYFNKNVNTSADTLIPTLATRTILEAPVSGAIGASAMDANFRTEYAESATLGIQHTWGTNWLTEVNWFGSRVIGADDSTWTNIPLPGPGDVASRRPTPQLAGYKLLHWGGYSNYNALSFKLERRMSAGVAINANYTLSRATDVASSPGPTFSESNYPQDVRNRRAENALSSFDHRHRVAVSFVWQIAPASKSRLMGGWSLAGAGAYQSGAPFTVNLPNDNANIGAGPSQRPDVLRDPNIETRSPEHWFDTSAFVMPKLYSFGNAGRNITFADGLTNTDLALAKRTALTDRVALELRFEGFNVFNNTNFADAPGRIAFTANFGRYFTAENPRQVQIAAKLIF